MKISIVIVSWNVKKLLLDCLSSFYKKEDIEIIVIDNNSQDGTVEALKEKFKGICIISNINNPGFSVANNQGFSIATGEYIYILNPDTFSSYEDLKKLIKVFDSDSNIGGVSPKIFYGNGEIQRSCARKIPTIWSQLLLNILRLYNLPLIGNKLLRKLKYPYDYNVSSEIEACSGAAYLVRSTIVKALNGFDENFIHTGEDTDLMKRVKDLGYKNYYCANSYLTHYAGQSSKQDIARVKMNTYLSVTYYLQKHFGKGVAQFYRFSILLIELPLTWGQTLYRKFKGRNISKKMFVELKELTVGVILWRPIKR